MWKTDKKVMGIMTGNLFYSEMNMVSWQIPEYLHAGRLVCRIFDTFEKCEESLATGAIPTESAVFIRRSDTDGSERFAECWNRSDLKNSCIVIVTDGSKLAGIEGLVFYPEAIRPADNFYRVREGDILDFQLPLGKINVDLPREVLEQRKQGDPDTYIKQSHAPGLETVIDKYSRFYLLKGSMVDHYIIDCGFGTGDLKQLLKETARGDWKLLLTHGHKDHAGGCKNFAKLAGNKLDLEKAGILYSGQVTELSEGKSFRIGMRTVRVIDLSGHSVGDYGFYIEPDRILICGDAIATGPNYTMAKGGDIARWIASLERLQQKLKPRGNLEIKELWCSHREGKLTDPYNAIQKMKEGLLSVQQHPEEGVGATVYGFGAVHYKNYEDFSFFY